VKGVGTLFENARKFIMHLPLIFVTTPRPMPILETTMHRVIRFEFLLSTTLCEIAHTYIGVDVKVP
jgi:hypothetical protein